MKSDPLVLDQVVLDQGSSEQQEMVAEIQALLIDKLSIRVQSADVDLFETGALDSVAMVRLLFELEEHFGLYLPMEDLGIDSFRSISRIAETVDSRMGIPSRTDSAVPASHGVFTAHNLVTEIQALFRDKMSIRVESPDQDLFQSGIFDSMTLVEFIFHLEERFAMQFPMEELELDSILNVTKIAEMVASQQRAATSEVA